MWGPAGGARHRRRVNWGLGGLSLGGQRRGIKALGRDRLCLVPRVMPSYPLNLLGPLFSLARQGTGLCSFLLCKSCPGQVRGRLEGPAPGCLDGRRREPQSALVQVAHLSPPAPSPGTNSSEAQSRDPLLPDTSPQLFLAAREQPHASPGPIAQSSILCRPPGCLLGPSPSEQVGGACLSWYHPSSG